MPHNDGPPGGDSGNPLIDIGWELAHVGTIGKSEKWRYDRDVERQREPEPG